jgi:hypothetical protein
MPAGFADGVDNDTLYSPGTGLSLVGTTFSLNTAYTDGRYWKLTGNAGTTPGVNFVGTTDNQPLELKTYSTRALRLEPGIYGSWYIPNVIGGSPGNFVGAGAVGNFIGGGSSWAENTTNYITGANHAVIGGGWDNHITNGYEGVIAGGYYNTLAGYHGAIGGGSSNLVTGDDATVPGGAYNAATAQYAFAAGRHAKANHRGTFVWADSQTADFASYTNDTFLIRATNGVGINTTSPDAVLDVYGTRNIGNSSDGIVNIGNTAGLHVTLDNNELHAKNGANNSTLYLNDYGGNVYIADSAIVAYSGNGAAVNGPLSVSGAATLNGTATMNAGATVDGNARVTGMVRIGSESGAAPPYYPSSGLVIRRVASTTTSAGSVVACTDRLTLERDGTSGGVRISWSASPGYCVVNATGVTTGGAQVAFHYAIANPGTAGTVTVFSSAQSVSHYDISFGYTYYTSGHHTHVVLDRYDSDYYLMGTITSSYNQ